MKTITPDQETVIPFKIKMTSDTYASPEEAFNGMIKVAEQRKLFNIFLAKPRGFKRTFREANIPLDKFIDMKARACRPPQPIVCGKDIDGWIFCGSVETLKTFLPDHKPYGD